MTYDATGAIRLSSEEKDRLAGEFVPKIKSWVLRISTTLPASVDVDDLYSAACVGLIEAMEKFEKNRNVTFHTYAERRIKGAILDSLRSLDHLPRNVRTKLKQLQRESEALGRTMGRKPTPEELIQHTGMDPEDVYRLLDLAENDKPLSLDENVGSEEGSSLIDFIKSNDLTPEDEVVKTKLVEKLGSEIDSLAEKERLVVTLYYYEELTMKEIAEVLGITESRVSQIHSAAAKKLQRRLKEFHG